MGRGLADLELVCLADEFAEFSKVKHSWGEVWCQADDAHIAPPAFGALL